MHAHVVITVRNNNISNNSYTLLFSKVFQVKLFPFKFDVRSRSITFKLIYIMQSVHKPKCKWFRSSFFPATSVIKMDNLNSQLLQFNSLRNLRPNKFRCENTFKCSKSWSGCWIMKPHAPNHISTIHATFDISIYDAWKKERIEAQRLMSFPSKFDN